MSPTAIGATDTGPDRSNPSRRRPAEHTVRSLPQCHGGGAAVRGGRIWPLMVWLSASLPPVGVGIGPFCRPPAVRTGRRDLIAPLCVKHLPEFDVVDL